VLDTEKSKNKPDSDTNRKKMVNLILPDKIHEKIEKLVSYRKFSDDNKYSKSDFLQQAINEKIDKERQDSTQLTKSDKSIFFKIDPTIYNQISKHVEIVKCYRNSFSNKRWMEDAVLEKIDRDEASYRSKFEERQNELLQNS
jgi:Arc/MetJ-type ribon-helix-helix transcriptional regulator